MTQKEAPIISELAIKELAAKYLPEPRDDIEDGQVFVTVINQNKDSVVVNFVLEKHPDIRNQDQHILIWKFAGAKRCIIHKEGLELVPYPAPSQVPSPPIVNGNLSQA